MFTEISAGLSIARTVLDLWTNFKELGNKEGQKTKVLKKIIDISSRRLNLDLEIEMQALVPKTENYFPILSKYKEHFSQVFVESQGLMEQETIDKIKILVQRIKEAEDQTRIIGIGEWGLLKNKLNEIIEISKDINKKKFFQLVKCGKCEGVLYFGADDEESLKNMKKTDKCPLCKNAGEFYPETNIHRVDE